MCRMARNEILLAISCVYMTWLNIYEIVLDISFFFFIIINILFIYFMYMAYDRVDRDTMWNVLRMYGVGGKLLKAEKGLYAISRACVSM